MTLIENTASDQNIDFEGDEGDVPVLEVPEGKRKIFTKASDPDIIGIRSKTYLFKIRDQGGQVRKVPLFIRSIGFTYELTSDNGWNEFRGALKKIVSNLVSKDQKHPQTIHNQSNLSGKIEAE
jgi:hypothetical protein